MSEPTVQPPAAPAAPSPARRSRRRTACLALVTGLLLAAMVWGYYLYYPTTSGPAQPIPFSHRFHAGEKQISCLMCHTGVVDTQRAGLPPLETCMLCHKRIIIDYPAIKELREHYEANQPIEWVRVNHLPEFVYNNHEAHIRRGVDCAKCHGDVAGMDRVTPSPELTMGFCVQCHRDENVSHDCLVCHR